MSISEIAIKTAKYSNVKRAKVAAIAFSGSGEIIATAHNRRFNKHEGKFTQHAEEVLLYKLHKLKAFNRFKNITILIIRITKHGLSMAKPCAECQKLLKQYNVNVLYSGWDKQIHAF
jgi:cytidine deaminase